eukprot:TRINITY_DN8293_c0_g1_i1.p2 TRINITY_DN8293_c0_g1~~TRINITY_DN8293_c0_g1_i1.p2  ORF type:complete len:114 (-),score=5.69 TRINITY_DN8293_c0_g1_i1:166-507(-)
MPRRTHASHCFPRLYTSFCSILYKIYFQTCTTTPWARHALLRLRLYNPSLASMLQNKQPGLDSGLPFTEPYFSCSDGVFSKESWLKVNEKGDRFVIAWRIFQNLERQEDNLHT